MNQSNQLLRSIYFLAVIIGTVLATQSYFYFQHKAAHKNGYAGQSLAVK